MATAPPEAATPAAARSAAWSRYHANSALVLLNQGAGLFAVSLEIPVGPLFDRAAVADLSGDGKPDLVLGGSTVATYLLLNQSK